MSNSIRNPAVSGSFYPEHTDKLTTMVKQSLRSVRPMTCKPIAVISPHAGYAFSGTLTARALAATAGVEPGVIVILSPSHRHAFDGIALPSHSGFGIPGAVLEVADGLRAKLIKAGLARVEDAAHDREHGIEVQLPFLHQVHTGVPILPLVIGNTTAGKVAEVIDFVAQKAYHPLFILSSDLSHYMDKPSADARDAATAKRLETGQTGFTGADACGACAIDGYLHSRQGQGNRFLRLGMSNSSARTKDENRTVGYGTWALMPYDQACFSGDERYKLLTLARRALTSRLARGAAPHIESASFTPSLQTHMASFVTLENNGRLRGCIGSLRPHRPLVEDVAINVQKAALQDPRFRPVRSEDVNGLRIKIALLSPMRQMEFSDQNDLEDQLAPFHDGVLLRDGDKSGTFLPMVWDKLEDPHAFVQALKQKAGLPPDHWSDRLTIYRYRAESFVEDDPDTT